MKIDAIKEKLRRSKDTIMFFIIIGLIYLVLLLLFRYFDITQDKIHAWIGQFGAFSVLALFLVQFIGSMTPIPDALITAIGMILYGPFWGGLIIWIGMYLAGFVHYTIAKKVGKEFIITKLPQVGQFIDKVTAENLTMKLTYLRMFMVISFDVASYVAGVAGASFKQFTLSFIFGLMPHLISYAFITQGLLSNSSPLSVLPGIMIFVVMFVIAKWPKRSKIIITPL